MRFGIMYKVGGILSAILVITFGASVWISTWHTVASLNRSSANSLEALHNAGVGRAKNVFSSLETAAKGSLERGEMESFSDMLKELGKIEGVKEIGLTNPTGKIVYSSIPANINTAFDRGLFEKTVASESHAVEKEIDETIVLTRGPLFEADCIRCHFSSKKGDLSGILYVRYSMAELAAARGQIAKEISTAKGNSIVVGIIAALCGLAATVVALYFMLRNSITRPLEKVNRKMDEMERGRCSDRLNIQQHDEIGHMALAMDNFSENLQKEVVGALQCLAQGDLTFSVNPVDSGDIVRGSLKKVGIDLNQTMARILDAGELIASDSNEVSADSQSLKNGANQQASALGRISSAVQQIAGQSRENAENAKQANTLSSDAKAAAEKGYSHMQEMVTAMSGIDEAGRNISRIIKVIDEIAFQTNLLALNAAVEAARAGHHGKGFAVVAEEVRNLAARSAKAASETATLIEGAVTKTEHGAQTAKKTAEALDEIVDSITRIAEFVNKINTASSEQAHGISLINDDVRQIGQITQMNMTTIDKSAEASEQLARQASRMREMLVNFKLAAADPGQPDYPPGPLADQG